MIVGCLGRFGSGFGNQRLAQGFETIRSGHFPAGRAATSGSVPGGRMRLATPTAGPQSQTGATLPAAPSPATPPTFLFQSWSLTYSRVAPRSGSVFRGSPIARNGPMRLRTFANCSALRIVEVAIRPRNATRTRKLPTEQRSVAPNRVGIDAGCAFTLWPSGDLAGFNFPVRCVWVPPTVPEGYEGTRRLPKYSCRILEDWGCVRTREFFFAMPDGSDPKRSRSQLALNCPCNAGRQRLHLLLRLRLHHYSRQCFRP
jgi:hypothetical protein